jgi:parallel beta-helix repeat protein
MDRTPGKLLRAVRIQLIRGLPLFILAVPSTGRAATVTVDCDAGGKIQTAIDAARPGDTIQVSGVCNENVRFNDEVSRITLDGQRTATIHGPNPAANAITIRGRGITISGFIITGGRNGVGVLMGGAATIQGNTIQDTAENGINVAQHSYARIIGNTIQFNPDAGIRVLESSSARIGFLDLADPAPNGNDIRRNGTVGGVLVQRSASASLVGNIIDNNDGPGVTVTGGSHAVLAANTIDGNASDAIAVAQSSGVQLGDEPGILNPLNETTVLNGGFGLRCSFNSSTGGGLGTIAGVQGLIKFDSSCSNGPKIK